MMNRISSALQATEGRHPAIEELLRLADAMPSGRERWQPAGGDA
jgi:hypothetical protein